MDKKIENIKGIADISGFGKNEGYEKTCQTMLQAGFEWVCTNPEKGKKLKGHGYKNIYGIFNSDSEETEELSDVVVKSVDDCTGAMHQAVMSHLLYIQHNGLEKWKLESKK